MKISVHEWSPLWASIQNYCCQGMREFSTLKSSIEKDGIRMYAPREIKLTSPYVTYGGDAQIRGELTYKRLSSALMRWCPFCCEPIEIVEEPHSSCQKVRE